MFCLTNANKRTNDFSSGFLENIKDKAFEVLKIKEFTIVTDCFQDESNAVFGVFQEPPTTSTYIFVPVKLLTHF